MGKILVCEVEKKEEVMMEECKDKTGKLVNGCPEK
jgi:hypothetical protein